MFFTTWYHQKGLGLLGALSALVLHDTAWTASRQYYKVEQDSKRHSFGDEIVVVVILPNSGPFSKNCTAKNNDVIYFQIKLFNYMSLFLYNVALMTVAVFCKCLQRSKKATIMSNVMFPLSSIYFT